MNLFYSIAVAVLVVSGFISLVNGDTYTGFLQMIFAMTLLILLAVRG